MATGRNGGTMILDALDQAWRGWAELGRSLPDAQWDVPTRLDGWNVRHVYAHYADAPAVLAAAIRSETERAAPIFPDAASLLRHLQQPGGVAETGADSIREAAVRSTEHRPNSELVEQFDTVAPEVLADMRTRDLSRNFDYGGHGTVQIGEALRLALMEAVVHYFDMAAALELDVPGRMAGAPVRDTVALLAGVADPVTFIDVATGRAGSQVFPVLR